MGPHGPILPCLWLCTADMWGPQKIPEPHVSVGTSAPRLSPCPLLQWALCALLGRVFPERFLYMCY